MDDAGFTQQVIILHYLIRHYGEMNVSKYKIDQQALYYNWITLMHHID